MIFAKETPHVWLWITFEAESLKDDCLPLPSNYQEVLKAECKKLQKTNTPGILCYLAQMLTEKQKQRMEEFANPEENLFVLDFNEVLENLQPSGETNMMLIDYIEKLACDTKDRFEKRVGYISEDIKTGLKEIGDGDFKKGLTIISNNIQEIKNRKKEPDFQLEKRIPSFLQQELQRGRARKKVAKGRFIDRVKLILVCYCNAIALCVKKKFGIEMYDGILLRDFDVILKMDKMPNITLPKSSAGVFLSTNYNNHGMQTSFAKCGKSILPVERYAADRAKVEDRMQFDISSGCNILIGLFFKLEPENSLIGANRSHNSLIEVVLSLLNLSSMKLLSCKSSMELLLYESQNSHNTNNDLPDLTVTHNDRPYHDLTEMVVEDDKKRGNDSIQFSLEVIHSIFEIGNDRSWEKSADQLYDNNQKLVVDNKVASNKIDNPDTKNLIEQRNESSSSCNRSNRCNIL